MKHAFIVYNASISEIIARITKKKKEEKAMMSS